MRERLPVMLAILLGEKRQLKALHGILRRSQFAVTKA
jgi:hypothetical protein